ncbi:MAG: winged helix-turn-helix transcriptional regulator [Bdellovibrionales bacterium]|nr:winged helix-turn-helix transcriptional regulator [Bdellovibrionales bacterium]
MKKQKKTNPTIYELQAEICGALAHPVRLHLLELLTEGEKNCTELIETLKISKANLSQHLTLMKSVGIVESRRDGLYQYISLALPQIKDACGMVRQVLLKRLEKREKFEADLRKQLKRSV